MTADTKADEIESIAEELHETAVEAGEDLSKADLVSELEHYVNTYFLPPQDAKNKLRDEYNLYESEIVPLDEITERVEAAGADDDIWADVEIEYVQDWAPYSDAVAQTGLITDNSGALKFISFGDAVLEEGKTYKITNLVADEYDGDISMKLTTASTVTEIDKDISTTSIDGTVTAVQAGSGLIKRCSHEECSRVLYEGNCSEHGQVTGEHDLRVKAYVGTGEEAVEAIFDAAQTAELTGISLEAARTMAQDALDPQVVHDEIFEAIAGRSLTIHGPKYDNDSNPTVLVTDFEFADPLTIDDLDQTLIRVRS